MTESAPSPPPPGHHASVTGPPTPPTPTAAPSRGLRLTALAGAAVFPLVVGATVVAHVAGAGGLSPASSDTRLVEVFTEYRARQHLATILCATAAAATLVLGLSSVAPAGLMATLATLWLACAAVVLARKRLGGPSKA